MIVLKCGTIYNLNLYIHHETKTVVEMTCTEFPITSITIWNVKKEDWIFTQSYTKPFHLTLIPNTKY